MKRTIERNGETFEYDFGGWATRNNVKCSDGRTILQNAFEENDGMIVPLVWNHQHNEAYNVLGHALLENRKEGVYSYCSFNDTEQGQNAKLLVEHKDVSALSIYANQLRQNSRREVSHGMIREVSLVLAGANPQARIDDIITHGDDEDGYGADIFTANDCELSHADENSEKKENSEMADEKKAPEKEEKEETVQDVFNTLTEKQKTVVYALIGQALEHSESEADEDEDDEEEKPVKHNVFDTDTQNEEDVLSHSEMMAVITDAKRYGTMKESALQHGIENIDLMFPEAKAQPTGISWIERDMGWVSTVLNGVHHTPFSRVKSLFANITEDEARARGYIKGRFKKEEVFSLLKRATTPQTIYKKQRLDRDDVIDITDFDVVGMIKAEMRKMLDEELARAILIGDGRLASDDDKISEEHIRPIAFDDDFYTIKVNVQVAANADDQDKAKAFIKSIIKARKNYKGSGSPTLYCTEDIVTDCLLLEDSNGRFIYETVDKLAQTIRVSKIVTVPVMEGVKGANGGDLLAVFVNLNDYNVGADRGGAVSLFDDFDIDYNQMKYLIETRCSGALIKPYSAMAIEMTVAQG